MVSKQDTHEIENTEDVIDVREVIARVEFLEGGEEVDQDADSEDQRELSALVGLLGDLKGKGGDAEWRGAWYPLTLIRDSYFEENAKEWAKETGAINMDAWWPNNHIDWKAAVEELRMDHTQVDFGGVTYWYR